MQSRARGDVCVCVCVCVPAGEGGGGSLPLVEVLMDFGFGGVHVHVLYRLLRLQRYPPAGRHGRCVFDWHAGDSLSVASTEYVLVQHITWGAVTWLPCRLGSPSSRRARKGTVRAKRRRRTQVSRRRGPHSRPQENPAARADKSDHSERCSQEAAWRHIMLCFTQSLRAD